MSDRFLLNAARRDGASGLGVVPVDSLLCEARLNAVVPEAQGGSAFSRSLQASQGYDVTWGVSDRFLLNAARRDVAPVLAVVPVDSLLCEPVKRGLPLAGGAGGIGFQPISSGVARL